MSVRLIRTTMQPDKDVQVDESNFLDLQRQGLILPGFEGEYDGPTPDPTLQAGTRNKEEGE